MPMLFYGYAFAVMPWKGGWKNDSLVPKMQQDNGLHIHERLFMATLWYARIHLVRYMFTGKVAAVKPGQLQPRSSRWSMRIQVR
jgi:hypothetical protein